MPNYTEHIKLAKFLVCLCAFIATLTVDGDAAIVWTMITGICTGYYFAGWRNE